MQKEIITTIITTAVITLVLGYVVSDKIAATRGDTFEAGWEAAKERLTETGYDYIITGEDEEMMFINGEVESIEGNKINVKIYSSNPFSDPELDNRVVVITDNTKIYKSTEKDMEEYDKEMEEYGEKMAEWDIAFEEGSEMLEMPEMPDFYLREEASLSEIKEGFQISVMAQENIKDVKEFETVQIEMFEVSETPEMPES